MLISSSENPVNDEAPFLHCFLPFIPFVFIRSVTVFYRGRNIERGPLVGSGEKTGEGVEKKEATSEES